MIRWLRWWRRYHFFRKHWQFNKVAARAWADKTEW